MMSGNECSLATISARPIISRKAIPRKDQFESNDQSRNFGNLIELKDLISTSYILCYIHKETTISQILTKFKSVAILELFSFRKFIL